MRFAEERSNKVLERVDSCLWCVTPPQFLLWGQHTRLKLAPELDDVDVALTILIALSAATKYRLEAKGKRHESA